MFRRLLKIIHILICSIILCLAHCSKDEKGATQPEVPEIADPNPPTLPVLESVSFPIMTWFGIPSEYLDIQHFQELADAGFTINFSHLGTEVLNLKALNLARQVGVKLVVNDNRINPNDKVSEAALKLVDNVVKSYKDHSALFGYHVRDEPSALIFNNLAAIKNRILSQDRNHLVYSNLFPDYAATGALGASSYQVHVDQFMLIFKPQILSYDHYPFARSGFRRTYYQNMEVIRAAAIANSVPFWAFTMSTAIDPAYPEPQEAWIRLQVFTDLAYGARGIQYFTYGLPRSNTENFTIAILDDNGNTTYLYDIAKRVNTEIHALAPTLKRLSSTGVYHAEPLKAGTRGLPDDFLVKSVTGLEVVIGHFKDLQDVNYLMIVSREYENGGNATLAVSDDVAGLIEISKMDGTDQPALIPQNNSITIQLEAGDGRLFRVEPVL